MALFIETYRKRATAYKDQVSWDRGCSKDHGGRQSTGGEMCAPSGSHCHTVGTVLTAQCHTSVESYCYWDWRGNKGCRRNGQRCWITL